MSGPNGFGGVPDRDMLAVWAECERLERRGGEFSARLPSTSSPYREELEDRIYAQLVALAARSRLRARDWGEE